MATVTKLHPKQDVPYDERSFIDLYVNATGVSETPEIYHKWCALATIAACVADRVWIEKFKGKKLSPNLYLILLGPSGNGKGTAMGFAEQLLRTVPRMNMWNGMITAPSLIDKLGKSHKDPATGRKIVANSKILLLTPEMATAVGEGLMADKFVKLMTALYEGHTDWSEGTRTSGEVEIKNCNINWIAGSTAQWMVECLPKSSIDSGFLARSIIAPADYDYSKRIPIPLPPPDLDVLMDQLYYRCFAFAALSGEFEVSDEAYEVQDRWYMTRPQEHDIALEAAWHRDDDLCWKLAMILSLSEGIDMVIEAKHWLAANRLVRVAHRDLPKLLTMASQTIETECVGMMRDIIKRSRKITHRLLMQKLSAKGKRAAEIREASMMLKSLGEIEYESGPRGGTIYAWKG